MAAHRPEWMAANIPRKLFGASPTAAWMYAAEWVLENEPEWAIANRRVAVEARRPGLIPKPVDAPDYIRKIIETKRREENGNAV